MKLSRKFFITLIKDKTGIFLLITIGLTAVLFGYCFVLSCAAADYEENSKYAGETRTLVVEGKNGSVLTAGQLKQLWNSKISGISRIQVYDREKRIVGRYEMQPADIHVSYGRYFTEQEMKYGENKALVSESYLAWKNPEELPEFLGGSIRFSENVQYQAIGRYSPSICTEAYDAGEVMIPFLSFAENGFSSEDAVIVSEKRWSSQQIEELKSVLRKIKGMQISKMPERFEWAALREYVQAVLAHVFILLTCLLLMTVLLKYWIEENKERFYVYYLCGCTRRKLVWIVEGSVIQLCIFPGILAVLFYRLAEAYFSEFGFLSRLSVMEMGRIVGFVLAVIFGITAVLARKQFYRWDKMGEGNL